MSNFIKIRKKPKNKLTENKQNIQKLTKVIHINFKTKLVVKAGVHYNTLGQTVEADHWMIEKFNLRLFKNRKVA